MVFITPSLKTYIETEILPRYAEDRSGHGRAHIEYVIRRSMQFAEEIGNLNIDMVYTIAAFHDLGHPIDKANHEKLSKELFVQDEAMKTFFTEEQRKIIGEAIEDHRASLEGNPRSVYGKIVSTADRSTNLNEFLRRTHAYSVKHEPQLSFEQHTERAYAHMQAKYGTAGYAKSYFPDAEYEVFKAEIQDLLENRSLFFEKYTALNGNTIRIGKQGFTKSLLRKDVLL